MADLWYPGGVHDPAPEEVWGSFTDVGEPKFLLHTTEGGLGVYHPDPNIGPGRRYYGNTGTWPNYTLAWHPASNGWRVYNHIPANRSSLSLRNRPGGVQTNRDNVTQVEIATRAVEIRNLPPQALDELANLLAWEHRTRGVPLVSTVRWVAYPVSYGEAAPQRLSGPSWDAYAGVCFPAGVLVTTSAGQMPIELVRAGDLVLTHVGRWRPVTATYRRAAATVRLVGQGHPGLEVTAEHPFWSTTAELRKRGGVKRLYHSEPEWIPASELTDRYWATPSEFPETEPPPLLRLRGKGHRRPPSLSPELMWIVGRWVADGHVGVHAPRSKTLGKVTFSIRDRDVLSFTERLRSAGFASVTTKECPGCSQLTVGSASFAHWLIHNFGRGAEHKTVPSWLLGAHDKYRRAFWSGYMSGDGHREPTGRLEAKTTSKPLAVGLRLLGSSLGYASSLYLLPASTATFGGRAFQCKPRWRITFSDRFGRGTATRVVGTHRFSRVRSVKPGGESVPVFNIAVAGDESYVADGIVVHNCGHQHAPENDHGDPGDFPVQELLSRAMTIVRGDDVTEQDKIDIANRVLEALRAQVFSVSPPILQGGPGQTIGATYNKVGDLQSWAKRMDARMADIERQLAAAGLELGRIGDHLAEGGPLVAELARIGEVLSRVAGVGGVVSLDGLALIVTRAPGSPPPNETGQTARPT